MFDHAENSLTETRRIVCRYITEEELRTGLLSSGRSGTRRHPLPGRVTFASATLNRSFSGPGADREADWGIPCSEHPSSDPDLGCFWEKQ